MTVAVWWTGCSHVLHYSLLRPLKGTRLVDWQFDFSLILQAVCVHKQINQSMSVCRLQLICIGSLSITCIWDDEWGGSREPCIRRGAHWRHLANTIEPSVCGGDMALCQITLTTCYLFDTILDLLLYCGLAFSCTSYLCCSKMRQLLAIRFVVNDTDVARRSLCIATVVSV